MKNQNDIVCRQSYFSTGTHCGGVEKNREKIGTQQYEPLKSNSHTTGKKNNATYVYITRKKEGCTRRVVARQYFFQAVFNVKQLSAGYKKRIHRFSCCSFCAFGSVLVLLEGKQNSKAFPINGERNLRKGFKSTFTENQHL